MLQYLHNFLLNITTFNKKIELSYNFLLNVTTFNKKIEILNILKILYISIKAFTCSISHTHFRENEHTHHTGRRNRLFNRNWRP